MLDIPQKAGIYTILNEITRKVYIGSAINLLRRKDEHFYNAIKNHYDENVFMEILGR